MMGEVVWLLERSHIPIGMGLIGVGVWLLLAARGWIGRVMGLVLAQVAAVLLLVAAARAGVAGAGETAAILVPVVAAASLLGCVLIVRLRGVGGALTPTAQSHDDPDA